jgi:hypothetical protein
MNLQLMLFAVLLATPPSEDPGRLRRVVHDRNLQARESVRSIAAQFTIDTTQFEDGAETGEILKVQWWQEGLRRRMKSEPVRRPGPIIWGASLGQDEVIDDKTERTLLTISSDKSPDHQGTIVPLTEERTGWTDFWGRAMFIVVDAPTLWVSDALAAPENVKEIRRDRLGEAEVVRAVVATKALGDCTIWFDAGKSYLVRKIAVEYEKNPTFAGFEKEAIEFQEVKPGFWFPKIVEMRVFKRKSDAPGGRFLWRLHRTTFDKVTVNEPIDPKSFVLEFPEGTQVRDQLAGMRYTWGKGQPATKPVPIEDLPAPTYGMEGKPPSHRLLTLFVINGAALAVAIGIFIYQRRRRAQQPRVPRGTEPS